MITIDGPIGALRQCPVCLAPIVHPFPADWELEMIKEGPPEGPVTSYYTPHRPGCSAPYADPQPGVAIRVPGRYVANIHFDLRPDAVVVTSDGGRNIATMIPSAGHVWTAPFDPAAKPDFGDLPGFTAIGHIAEGQAVQIVDGEFVKPTVRYDVDGEPER